MVGSGEKEERGREEGQKIKGADQATISTIFENKSSPFGELFLS
jgi:hypothetical protein